MKKKIQYQMILLLCDQKSTEFYYFPTSNSGVDIIRYLVNKEAHYAIRSNSFCVIYSINN